MARLLDETPELSARDARMLAELVPFPRLVEGEVVLVACRWPLDRSVPVRLAVSGPRVGWARRTIDALERGTRTFGLALEVATEASVARAGPRIEILEVDAEHEPGPRGLGDTLVLCDVAAHAPEGIGVLREAQIVMRAGQVHPIDGAIDAPAEAWSGALLHELGHALGFQGHLRTGSSALRLDRDRLRRAGRKVLAGEDWRDPALEALYRLPGESSLGRRPLAAGSRRWVDGIERALASQGGSVGVWASVGDRSALLEWRARDGGSLRLVFPGWARQLRSGGPLVALPSPDTRRAIAALEVAP